MAAGKSWLELCAEGHKVYYGESVARQGPEVIGQYTQSVMDQSQKFVRAIAKPGMHILDLGSSGEPWFSFLAADAGAKLVAYDIEPPAQPNMLKDKGIEYVQGNVSKLDNLGRFDLVFCRNLYPAQMLQDWHDPDFLEFWHALLDMSKSVYWTQISNGKGVQEAKGLPFANYTREYFAQFFEKLGSKATIRKYGSMSFEIGQQPVLPGVADLPRHDLSQDEHALCKWYAYQLQDVPQGVKLNHRLIKALLKYNFLQGSYRSGAAELSKEGPAFDDYFLVGGQEDRRFSVQFARLSKWPLAYKIAKAAVRMSRKH